MFVAGEMVTVGTGPQSLLYIQVSSYLDSFDLQLPLMTVTSEHVEEAPEVSRASEISSHR